HFSQLSQERAIRMPAAVPQFVTSREPNVARTIERVLLESYAPASAIFNEQGEVVYFSGPTGKFLEPPAGAPSSRLINMARKSLRVELRAAIQRAVSTRSEVLREN